MSETETSYPFYENYANERLWDKIKIYTEFYCRKLKKLKMKWITVKFWPLGDHVSNIYGPIFKSYLTGY